MKVLLNRGWVLDGVTYKADSAGVEIPNKVPRKGKDGKPALWPIVKFEGWKDTDEAVPLPGDAVILSDDDAAELEAEAQQKLDAAKQKPMALSELTKKAPDEKLGGAKV